MKRFMKIYLEISNICNLRCSFCPGTKRKARKMTVEKFSFILPKLRPYTDFLYFHLMGEPLCHPQLEKFIALASDEGFKVILTTNGTLLKKQQDMLLRAKGLHKINISLHAFEANDLDISFEQYLDECLSFGKAAEGKFIVSYRLWNSGGLDSKNSDIINVMECYFPRPWKDSRQGARIGDRVYLQYGDKFTWPDMSAEDGGDKVFCYGMKDHIGILCDGTVVPCCLDHDGDIPLGNIFTDELGDILESERAAAIYNSFKERRAAEELCRKCGYAREMFG